MAASARFGFTALISRSDFRMEANTRPPHRPSPPSAAQPAENKSPRSYDQLLERSFYIGALALIALMEWYAHLTNTPRMPWAYFALVLIALAYGVRTIRPFKAWRNRRRVAQRQKNSSRTDDSDESGAVRISRRASRT